jgi:hypothetical protein
MSSTVETANEIRPFHVDIPEEELVELRRRIAAARWPSRELVADRSQGVQLATMQELARYWATEYDWRACEARLNALPQFTTTIDGVDLHFIHVKSSGRHRRRRTRSHPDLRAGGLAGHRGRRGAGQVPARPARPPAGVHPLRDPAPPPGGAHHQGGRPDQQQQGTRARRPRCSGTQSSRSS